MIRSRHVRTTKGEPYSPPTFSAPEIPPFASRHSFDTVQPSTLSHPLSAFFRDSYPKRRTAIMKLSRIAIVIITVLDLTATPRVQAQYNYSLNYQTNTISGVSSNWIGNGNYVVGSNTYLNALVIENGGVLNDGYSYVGDLLGGSNNAVLVTGSGSVWTNHEPVVGYYGAGNTLTISNRGQVLGQAGYLGYMASSSNNTVLVTGTGSVWYGDVPLPSGVNAPVVVGLNGSGNTLIISNGGAVVSADGLIGMGNSNSNNAAIVTGPGSVWNAAAVGSGDPILFGMVVGGSVSNRSTLIISNGGGVLGGGDLVDGNSSVTVTGPGSVWSNQYLTVGNNSPGNHLTIANGGAIISVTGNGSGYLSDGTASSNNVALVTGPGSVWSNQSQLYVGLYGPGNQLTVSNSGAVFAHMLSLGYRAAAQGTLTLAGGAVNVASLIVTNAGCAVVFNGGTLTSSGTAVTNAQTFAVGDAVDAATFQLNGGVHSFANNLEIRSNGVVIGCGTIEGNVTIDPGGTVLANCGTALNFSGGILTNNGTITASNGTVLNFYGPVVNHGVVNATNGGAQFYGGIANTGTILTPAETNSWTGGNGKWEATTNWSRAAAPSLTDLADVIANAGNNTVTIDATTSSNFPNTLTISNLIVAAPLNTTNTLLLSNAGTNVPLAVFNSVSVNRGGAMLLTNSALQVGGASGGALTVDGQLTLDSGTIWVSSNLLVGLSNPLSLVTIWEGALYVTNAAHNAVTEVRYGTLMLTGGVYFTDSLLITNTGASFLNDGGTFTITGLGQVDQGTQTVASGTTQVSSNLVVGTSANSTGTVAVTGGQLVVTNGVIGVGNSGTLTNGSGVGLLIVSNGTVLGSSILLGSSVGGQGQLTVQTNGLVNLVGTNAELVANDVLINGGELEIFNGILYCGITHAGSVTVANDGTAICQVVYVGDNDTGTMTFSGGQTTVSTLLDIGFASGSAGSVWMSGGQLTATALATTALVIGDQGVGQLSLSNGTIQASTLFVSTTGGPGGTLTVAGGTLMLNAGLIVGAGTIWVSGGQLLAPSSSIVVGSNGIGQIVISNGTVQANSLVLTNGANSQFALIGGGLSSGGTVVTNSQCFLVGNGSSAATFTMAGGAHWFGNGLEIASNATLTGCGVINGAVTVDAGAHAVATCGALTFSNTVTINGNGVVRASNGSVVNFAGPVVNNGAIDALNGGVNFSSPPSGTGYVLTASCLPVVTAIQHAGSDIHISFTTGASAPYAVSYETDLISGSWTTLTNVTGSGGIMTITNSGATLLPRRFYRVNLVVPP
jgi:T5SS/PEP-CTERM-associated repeat protein